MTIAAAKFLNSRDAVTWVEFFVGLGMIAHGDFIHGLVHIAQWFAHKHHHH